MLLNFVVGSRWKSGLASITTFLVALSSILRYEKNGTLFYISIKIAKINILAILTNIKKAAKKQQKAAKSGKIYFAFQHDPPDFASL